MLVFQVMVGFYMTCFFQRSSAAYNGLRPANSSRDPVADRPLREPLGEVEGGSEWS